MNFSQQLRARLVALLRKRKLDAEMDEEMRSHIELRTQANIAAGMTPEEARYAALRQFGHTDSIQEKCRDQRGVSWLEALGQDVRYGTRQLRKQPGFTGVAVLTLALCLGANLTIFAVVDAILLRPLPFPEADRLVTLFNLYPKAGNDRAGSSIANYYERRGVIPAFASLSIFRHDSAIIGEAGGAERETVLRVSPEFFETLGVNPALGRVFTEEETLPQADNAVILTVPFWRAHFSSDPGVLGRKIAVDGVTRTVVGVLPRDFRFLSSEARLLLPFTSSAEQRAPDRRHWGNGDELIARLRPGATIGEAQAQIDAQNLALDETTQTIARTGFRTIVASLRGDHVGSVRPILLLLQAGALLLLVIGGVNLVNLLLIRASGRGREVAIRQSLGASRGRVVGQVLVETGLLAFLGGLLGLAVGFGGIRLIALLGIDRLPLGAEVGFDGRLAVAAVLGSVSLGILTGLPIAWFNLHSRPADALQAESRGGTVNRSTQHLRHGFIVGQIALAFVLLTGAGLLGLSLKQAMAVAPGFHPDHVLTGHMALPSATYPDRASLLTFTSRLVTTLESQPGVAAVGIATVLPFSGAGHRIANTPVTALFPDTGSFHAHQTYGVTGNYFAAMGMGLRAGRFLDAGDTARAARVCVVDQNFARRYWPEGGALGQRVFQGTQRGGDADAFTIVGIVDPVKQSGQTEPESDGAVYYPLHHRAAPDFFVVLRTVIPPENVGPTLGSLFRGIDPNVPIDTLRTMDVRIADSLLARRSPAVLARLFAGVALLLAAIGTYGVLAYAVSQRRREIGVRLALGALPRQIAGQFLALGLRLAAMGTILGLLGAWLAGRAMQGVLFQVPALHPATLLTTAALMGIVALTACLLPTWRASRVEPVEALKAE